MRAIKPGKARPFVKWAGGKTQLIEQIISYLPAAFSTGSIKHYYEPFVGGGAVFFYLVQNYAISKAVLADLNRELILMYRVIQRDVSSLIDYLHQYYEQYMKLSDTQRRIYYYRIREQLNLQRFAFDYKKYTESWTERAAQLIFLNKTCYNGLFRLNKQGEFNVPFGRYINPKLLDKDNLQSVSELLQNVELVNSDFSFLLKEKADNSFIYFDPPYRPVSKTASFTSYNSLAFTDNEQLRLAAVFKELDKKGFYLMLSNSCPEVNPENILPEDSFFKQLYNSFYIHQVTAKRMINSKAEKRGKIQELLVTNYK